MFIASPFAPADRARLTTIKAIFRIDRAALVLTPHRLGYVANVLHPIGLLKKQARAPVPTRFA